MRTIRRDNDPPAWIRSGRVGCELHRALSEPGPDGTLLEGLRSAFLVAALAVRIGLTEWRLRGEEACKRSAHWPAEPLSPVSSDNIRAPDFSSVDRVALRRLWRSAGGVWGSLRQRANSPFRHPPSARLAFSPRTNRSVSQRPHWINTRLDARGIATSGTVKTDTDAEEGDSR